LSQIGANLIQVGVEVLVYVLEDRVQIHLVLPNSRRNGDRKPDRQNGVAAGNGDTVRLPIVRAGQSLASTFSGW
jgi:hypothetical protein